MNKRTDTLMETDNRFRHELKYLISRQEKECCMSRLMMFMKMDHHATSGSYGIRSLYFDDPAGSAYEEKESGVASRHKYRIRIYDNKTDPILLEKKIKEGNHVRKESARLSMEEYRMIEGGAYDFLLGRSEEAARQFAIECKHNLLRPEVIVDYERTPFVYAPGDVRVTFDENIRAVCDDTDIFHPTQGIEVMEAGTLIMEVKFTQFLPDVIRAVLPPEGCRLASSKYVLCDEVKRKLRGGR